MEINFGPKKVWNDLVESRENLKYLLSIILLVIIFNIVDVILKTRCFSNVGGVILGSYFVLMINNIIHDKKPILEKLGDFRGRERSLLMIIFKTFCIGLVYGITIGIIGVMLFFIFSKLLMLKLAATITISIILLIPLIILLFFSNLLFAENLKFSDAFNIKKSIASFKIAWSKYVSLFLINILLFIVLFVILMVVLVPLVMSVIYILKDYPALVITKETIKFTSGIIVTPLGAAGGAIIAYWYLNASAQVYKYSLTKMNITED